jgi:hypothetical protein
MQPPQFLYFLQDEDERFAHFDDVMGLSWQLQPVPVSYTPDGWLDMGLFCERNKKYWSLDVTYGIPQNFVEDAAGILKSIYYLQGIMGVCNLTILESQIYFTSTQYGFYYDTLVTAEIDFSTFVHSGPQVSSSILDSELTRLLKANEDTQYEIPFSPLGVQVYMDGLKLKQYVNFVISEPADPTYESKYNHILGMMVSSTEATTQLNTEPVERKVEDRDNVIQALTGYNFLTTSADDVTEFNWDFGLTIKFYHTYIDPNTHTTVQPPYAYKNPRYSLWIEYFTGDAATPFKTPLESFPIVLSKLDFNGSYDHFQLKGTSTLSIPKNSRVFLCGGLFEFANETIESGTDITPIAGRFNFIYDTVTSTANDADPNFVVNYYAQYPAAKVNALDAWPLFEKLVDKVTEGKYLAESTLLKNLKTPAAKQYKYKNYPKLAYTSGDALRRLSGAVIKTSLTDFFQDVNATLGGIGMGIVSNKLRIEEKAFWLKVADADVIPLGEVSGLKVSPATDYLFNTIDVGCPNETYGTNASTDINGRYEFNMTQHYTAPQNRVVAALDLTTKYRRDMYGIEFTRINLEGKATTDANSDNDVFVLHVADKKGGGPTPITVPGGGTIVVNYDPFYLLDRTANPFTTGLLDKVTAFNVMLSPKHCIFRAGDYIRSCLDRLEGKKITFASADKNLAMSTIYPNGLQVVERADITVGNLDAPLFRPVILECTSPMPEGYLTAGPVKEMSLTVDEGRIPLSGFPIKSGIQTASKKPQVSQLLCAPDVDLSPLINYFG